MKFGLFSSAKKLILLSVVAGMGIFSFIEQASAYGYKVNGSIYKISGEYGLNTVYLSTSQYIPLSAEADSGGFRLRYSGTDVCLNTGLYTGFGIKEGAPVNLYPCTPGDAGQVFQYTPNPGQLKFKAQSGTFCIKPLNYGPAYGNSRLVVGKCINSNLWYEF
jgi:hypothetical protein